MQDVDKYIQKVIEEQNRKGRIELEGCSPKEMELLLYDFQDPKCPVQISPLAEEEYLEIPLFNQVKYLLQLIADSGELKLTQRGNLPVKVVADIYSRGFMKDEWVESGLAKVYSEENINSIVIARVLLELSPLVKKRNNRLSLTRKGSKTLESNRLLFQELFTVFTTRYRWGFLDGFKSDHVGQFGFAYSLLLLHKYGETERTVNFYAEKFFIAFPPLLENSSLNSCFSIYSTRTFDRFLDFFGMVDLSEKNYREPQRVKARSLFYRIVKLNLV